MNIITVKDESMTKKVIREISLEFASDQVTVKEIIERRVLKEVDDYNKKLPEFFQGLVEPLEAEKTLNGYKLKPKKLIDGEKQVYIALDAFQKNGYFVLVNDIQASTLEQEVRIQSNTIVSFIKLTPLVGG